MSGTANWKKENTEWNAIDHLIEEHLIGEDGQLLACQKNCAEHGLPDISISAAQGRFLQLIASSMQAKRILEIGTLGGYSTIFLARGAGESGHVTTLEYEAEYARVARDNIDTAGLGEQVTILQGLAMEILPEIEGEFDLFFIDADKVNNCNYVDHALRLARLGAVIIVDNVVREGTIIAPDADDESGIGTRALYDHLTNHPRLSGTALQTVGSKGWDGMMFLQVGE